MRNIKIMLAGITRLKLRRLRQLHRRYPIKTSWDCGKEVEIQRIFTYPESILQLGTKRTATQSCTVILTKHQTPLTIKRLRFDVLLDLERVINYCLVLYCIVKKKRSSSLGKCSLKTHWMSTGNPFSTVTLVHEKQTQMNTTCKQQISTEQTEVFRRLHVM